MPETSSLANWDALAGKTTTNEPTRPTPMQLVVEPSTAVASTSIQEEQQGGEQYTEEEWQEWYRFQQGAEPERAAYAEEYHSVYPPESTSVVLQEIYQSDPSLLELPPPSAEELALSFAAGAHAFIAAMKRGPGPEAGQWLVSTSTVIDHGSPTPSPDLPALPDLPHDLSSAPTSFTKEEWLRLGGFAEAEQPQEPLHHQQQVTPRVGVEHAPPPNLPSPRYTFPSVLQPYNPADQPSQHYQHLPPAPFHPLLDPALLPPLPPPSVDSDFQLPRPSTSTTRTKSRARNAPSTKRKRARPSPYTLQSVEVDELEEEEGDLPPPELSKDLGTFKMAPIPDAPWSSKGGKSHARRTSVGHIPRPRNAFILFRSHALATKMIPEELGIKHAQSKSTIVAAIWKSLPAEERAQFERLAAEEKRKHKEMYPGYKYAPRKKGEASKRKVGVAKTAGKTERNAEEEDIEVDQLISDEEELQPTPSPAKKKPATPRKSRTPRPPQPFTPKESSEDVSSRMELVGQLLGQEMAEGRMAAVGVARDQPAPSSSSSRPSSNRSTPHKSRSRHTPYTLNSPSTSSDILVHSSPSSSNASTPRRHRPQPSTNPSTWAARGDTYSSSPADSLPYTLPPPPARQPKSGLYGSLGLGSSTSSSTSTDPAQHSLSFPSSSTRRPFLSSASFDNSPLLGGSGGDRKSSLGRWELRIPSSSAVGARKVSRREMIAQEEEEEMAGLGGGRRREVSKAFTIDPRLFLAEAGLEDEYDVPSSSGGGGYQPDQAAPRLGDPSKSSTKDPYSLPSPPPAESYHFGARELFSSPSGDVFGGGGGGGKGRTFSESARRVQERERKGEEGGEAYSMDGQFGEGGR